MKSKKFMEKMNKIFLNIFKYVIKFIIIFYGDWGLGIGDWGLGIGPNPQSPIPNPQSPIPNPQRENISDKKYFYLLNIYLNELF